MAGSTVYTVVGTNTAGCSSSQTLNINVYNSPTLTVNSGTICIGSSFTITPSGANTYTFSGGSSVVSPSTSSTYSVTGTDVNGCVSTPAVSNISVNPQPTISATNGTICSGESYTISPAGAVNYTYSGGSSVVSPTNSASYTITGGDAFGCSSLPISITISVNPLPVISISTTNTLICAGQTATLTASGANSFTWNTAATSSQIIVSPTITTNYTVAGTDLNNCSGTTGFVQNVSACTSIEESQFANTDLRVFPNPTSGILFIEAPENSEIELSDLLGNILTKTKTTNTKAEINCNDYKAGIYLIKINSGLYSKTLKIVRE